MLTILLQFHIALMTLSLIMTTLGVIAIAFGKSFSKISLRFNLMATIGGLATGTLLLIDNPLSLRCAMLAAYLVCFTIAYRYMARELSVLAQSSSS